MDGEKNIDKRLHTTDLLQYKGWLEEDLIIGWIVCAEYLIKKHECHKLNLQHKKLTNGSSEDLRIHIKTREKDTSKVPYSRQKKPIIEEAGIAFGLLMTLFLRPFSEFKVVMEGEGYDYYYIPQGRKEEELLEVTATEIPGEGKNRLSSKIRHFRRKHPNKSGYISVTCFPDKLQIHWGHRNET